MDPAGVDALRKAVEGLHQVKAVHVATEHARDEWQGQVAFDREIEVFAITEHPSGATRVYAWSEPGSTEKKTRFFAVLKAPPIESARDAVRATILADARHK